GVVVFFPPGETDDAKRGRQLFFPVEMVEGGNELARRQVAARAENDNRARFNGPPPDIETAGQHFIRLVCLFHRGKTMAKRRLGFNKTCCSLAALRPWRILYSQRPRDRGKRSAGLRPAAC